MKINHFREKVATISSGDKYYTLLEIPGGIAIMRSDGSSVRIKKGGLTSRKEKGLNLRQSVKDIASKAKATSTECLILSKD